MRRAVALVVALLAWPALAAGPEVQLWSNPAAFSAFLDGTAKDPRPVVVHFWATWCQECRKEMPKLPAIFAEAEKKGARVVLVSLDEPAKRFGPVRRFLDEAKVPGERYVLDAPDAEPILQRVGGTWDGAIPATFVFRQGQRSASFVGRLKGPRELLAAVAPASK